MYYHVYVNHAFRLDAESMRSALINKGLASCCEHCMQTPLWCKGKSKKKGGVRVGKPDRTPITFYYTHHFLTYNFVREFHSILIIYFDFDDLSNEANQMSLKIASINKDRRSFKYKKIQFNSINFKNCTKNIKLYNENISLWNLCTI